MKDEGPEEDGSTEGRAPARSHTLEGEGGCFIQGSHDPEDPVSSRSQSGALGMKAYRKLCFSSAAFNGGAGRFRRPTPETEFRQVMRSQSPTLGTR